MIHIKKEKYCKKTRNWGKNMKGLMARFLADESGATAVEYGLMGGAVIGGAMMSMHLIAESTSSMFAYVASFFTRF
ncbi:Flp family type IVb pilin [Burkholderia sp. Ac-20379]|uniref:Flp family type IVb pilin n=2 Tax=Burkholderia sp. Ac-20379 TaxID=2703900 RepID=UPI0030DC6F8E